MIGDMGDDIHRQGKKAEWPIIECADGHVALVYETRDWKPLVDLVNDDRLHADQHGVEQRPVAMRPLQRLRTGDPARVTAGRCDPAV